ncbi:MAG: hypothetical protein QOG28_5644 [Trebonia sp.]|nr:hypothetical protein [Trebonia sp.]
MGKRVPGKRVLVTGAARGMGRSHAVRLAEEGADMILIDLRASLPGLEYPLSSTEDLDETAWLVRELGRRAVTKCEVVDIFNLQGFERGQRPGLRRTFFGLPSRWNRILSQWNKAYIIRSTIGRYG